jgi:hypothetical protein
MTSSVGQNGDADYFDLDKYRQAVQNASISGSDKATDFDVDRFDQLLNRLEASKGRQQRQKSVEGRRDIFQQGLAGMMSNF